MGSTIIVSITSANCVTCHRSTLPSDLFTCVKSQSLWCVHAYLSNVKRAPLGLGRSLMERVLRGHTESVLSVAFSPDGTRVISGTLDDLVLIWDAITEQSTPLSCHESFQFSDRSKVTHIFPGQFQLFAPDQEEVLLSPDWKWILTRRPNEACWIPPECRDVSSYAISGSKVCLGCESGRVVIVDLFPRR